MKRTGNLYPKIAEPDNLRLAFNKAVRGKRSRNEVIRFQRRLDENLAELHRQLIEERVAVGDYRFFTVHDPKQRLICAAAFPERVLHHAVMNVCEPVLDAYALDDSYACRKGKGSQRALERARYFTGRYGWYLKLDIRRYFDSIDHAVLLGLLRRRFKDRRLLALLERIFDSYETCPGKGLPIGNLVSQHMANFYLGYLDHWLKEERRVPGYVRYMDDFVLFADEKQRLLQELAQIRRFLEERLQLALKDNVQLNRCRRGLPFLGFRVLPGSIRLAPRSRRRFVEKFCHYEGLWNEGVWDESTLARHMTPLVEFTRAGRATGFRRHVLEQYGVPF
ncbi:MAG: reverse transcriptase/maturase family protein [Syntrophotaleaceae bacterium]